MAAASKAFFKPAVAENRNFFDSNCILSFSLWWKDTNLERADILIKRPQH